MLSSYKIPIPAKWLIICLLFLTILYIHTAFEHSRTVNKKLGGGHAFTQNEHLADAMNMVNSNYKYMQLRNRMPLYPYLLSTIYKKEENKLDFFNRAKVFNIFLSLLLLPCYFSIFRKRLDSYSALNLTLIIAWTLYVYKASYVQVEPLFYFFYFWCYFLYTEFLRKEFIDLKLFAFTGILVGITFLTKASTTPALIIFLIFFILRGLFHNKNKKHLYFIAALTLIGFFLLTISFYISNSKKHYGTYFFNITPNVYMWCDTQEEIRAAGRKIYPDPKAYKLYYDNMPEKFFARHSLQYIISRVAISIPTEILAMKKYSYGYLYFVIIFLTITIGSIIYIIRKTSTFPKLPWLLISFSVLLFTINMILTGWLEYFALIGDWLNPRYVLFLYTPFLYFCYLLIYDSLHNIKAVHISNNKLAPLTLLNLFVSILIIIQIIYTCTQGIYVAVAGV